MPKGKRSPSTGEGERERLRRKTAADRGLRSAQRWARRAGPGGCAGRAGEKRPRLRLRGLEVGPRGPGARRGGGPGGGDGAAAAGGGCAGPAVHAKGARRRARAHLYFAAGSRQPGLALA